MRWSFTAFLSATKPNLQAQNISHGLSCFFLRRGGDVSIGVQSEPSGEVAQHSVLNLLYRTYTEYNPIDNERIKANFTT